MDRELLDAIRAVIREEIKPLDNRLSKIEDKIDYLSEVVEESLALHDELEQRVKILESKVV